MFAYRFNSLLGHVVGHVVLRSVARRLSSASDGIAKAFRLSGVRFVLLVSGAGAEEFSALLPWRGGVALNVLVAKTAA